MMRLVVLGLGAILIVGGVGCASSSGDSPAGYYRRGSVHGTSFPDTYGRTGYYRYGRPGRYY